MKSFYYCQMCGTILNREEIKNIVSKSWLTGKREKLFSTCPSCAEKVAKMKFEPICFSSRKKVQFYSITITDMVTRKSHKVYDILSEQLPAIKSLEVDVNKLKLTYKTGTRLYTEFQVKKWLQMNNSNLLEGLKLLYMHQTEDEQLSRSTKYANSVGFNKPDADFLTGMFRVYESRGAKAFSRKQIAAIKSKMLKYTKQLTLYINAEGLILKGV